MLNWLNRFNIFCLLDNHRYKFSDPAFELLAAAGSLDSLTSSAGNYFNDLRQFTKQHSGEWMFGHLGYDLKNEIENLSSHNFDGIDFPELFFFIPQIILSLKENILEIGVIDDDADKIFEQISFTENLIEEIPSKVNLVSRFSKQEYVSTVSTIKEHINKGDCYELNFCQEFYAENTLIDPVTVYKRLGKLSPNPFAAFYKLDDKFLMCCSPERYLKKEGTKLISQPIKGTSKRNLENDHQDEKNKKDLIASPKETSENVMVVDLTRNDLSKVCESGSVEVSEFLGLYSFPQVHQMISTVTGNIDANVNFSDIIQATFPMASMTGVPKIKVMELIEQHEKTRRGLYSGSLGYISPTGDFDFNVVIRSIQYNTSDKYLSIQAGAAITNYSVPENEYEECFIKIEAMKQALV